MPKKHASKSKTRKPEPQREQTLKELVQSLHERQDALEKKLDWILSLLRSQQTTSNAHQRMGIGVNSGRSMNSQQNNPFDVTDTSGANVRGSMVDMTDPFDM
jgi:hypothetical protein